LGVLVAAWQQATQQTADFESKWYQQVAAIREKLKPCAVYCFFVTFFVSFLFVFLVRFLIVFVYVFFCFFHNFNSFPFSNE
jgi:type II secretory pathway component PulF